MEFSTSALGGGSLIGNGAGITEQNIIYAYNALPTAIENCLNPPDICGLSTADAQVLTNIRAIAIQNAPTPDRVRYASETASPGFFDTEVGQAYRLAKTGLTPSAQIYWNTDQLYTTEGKPALDIPAISAIWVHELGHQTGILDHEYLDLLGSKVRLLLEKNLNRLAYQGQNLNANLEIVDNVGADGTADLYLMDGFHSFNLDPFVTQAARCSGADETVLGWSLENEHWILDRAIRPELDGMEILPFGAWIQVECLKGQDLVEETNYDFRLDLEWENMNGSYQFVKTLQP